MNRTLTRRAMGLPTDPWSRLTIPTADGYAIRDMVTAAIDDRALVSIVGPTGMGKSHAFRAALADRQAFTAGDQDGDLVRVRRLDREARTIADIVTALYRHLGRPRPTGGAEVRDAQLRQILGERVRVERGRPTRPLLVMLDDAHLLHWRTVDSLKGLREHDWMGAAPLLGIVLLSQSDPLATRREIREARSDTYTMSGLSRAEATAALDGAIGRTLTAEAIDTLAAHATGGGWNRMIEASDIALGIAHADGHRQVEQIDAVRATGAGLRDLAKAAGITQADIARQVGASETQVSRILSGERQDQALQDRITSILLGGGAQKAAAGAR